MPDFKAFSKIPRLNRLMVVTEKIDGTNALVWISDDLSEAKAGQRTMWIPWPNGRDNFGFGQWVKEHEEELKQLGPGYHYGEWYGLGIQRGYGLKEKRFALFRAPKEGAVPECCEVVPTLFEGDFSTEAVGLLVGKLRLSGSVAVPGYMLPEGVVVYHTASGQSFKVTCENDERPKTSTQ